MFFRWLRRLFLFALVIGVFAAVAFFIINDYTNDQVEQYNFQVTRAIETAIAASLFEATRTVEVPLRQYRLVRVGANESLLSVAEQYNTTIDVLRMANKLLATVDFGDGKQIIVPEGVQVLDPPRSFTVYKAIPNDTLSALASLNDVTIEQMEIDNPVLAGRTLIPGDTVFIPQLLT